MVSLPFTFEPSAVPAICDFSAMPSYPALEELKGRRQWVAWKYEERNGRLTKPPVSPMTGFGASHSKPTTWGSYRQAVDFAERKSLPGIGYVLSDDDDLTGADLDKVRDPLTGAIEPWARAIMELAETYVEVSPSGTGLRLIWRGKVDRTLKSDPCHVEVYRSQRYLTITGWHLDGTPEEILPAPRTWAALQARVDAWKAEQEPVPVAGIPVAEQKQGVASVTTAAPDPDGSPFFRNVNTAALADLAAWVPSLLPHAVPQAATGAWRVSSRRLGRDLEEDLSIAPSGIVDFGVHDMGDARAGKRTPIDLVMQFGGESDALAGARWLCGRLGRRPADLGWAEDDGRGAALADGLLATRAVIETPDGTLADAETGEVIEPAPVNVAANQDYPDSALQPGGLVGDIADWIMATAMYPCRLFAVSAALAAVGAAVSRQVYTGVPRAGASLYWLAIAPTAGGKDRPQEAIKQLFAAAGLSHLVKPSVSSSAKLGLSLAEQPAQLQVIDEVGKVLRKFVSRHASAQEMALLDDYCSVWGKNLGSFEPEGVTVRSDIVIRQPSLTFFGATTPTNFYSQLRSAQVAGGFLNRFLVMQRHERVPENPTPQPEDVVPSRLVEAIQVLRTWQDANLMPAPSHLAGDAGRPPPPFVVPVSDEAEILLTDARVRARAMILASDHDPVLEVYARSAEMVKRMALVLACGRHWRNMAACRIEAQDVRFASGLVDWSMASFVEGLRNHMAENEHQANAKMVLGLIRTARGRRLSKSDLYRKVDGRLNVRDLTGILSALSESGKIEALEEKPGEGSKGGRPKVTYILR